VVLPENPPAAVADRIADYQTKKSALKKELYDAVVADDASGLSFLFPGRLKALPDKQAARLAELESLAEAIRRGLAESPPPSSAAAGEPSPLPPVLTARVTTVLRGRIALQNDATAAIEEIHRRVRTAGIPVQLSYSFDPEGLKFSVAERRGHLSADILREIERIRGEMAAVSADYGRRLAELMNETESIRQDIGASTGRTQASAIEATLAATVRFVALRESDEAYREYRSAVFEPGLSPEQRRLLFGLALEKLDLPRPRGEPQPTTRAPSW